MSLKQQHFFGFGEFRLDPRQRILRTANQSEIPLAPKVFETLQVLVENHSVILDKDYLLKRIWPDAFVEHATTVDYLRQKHGLTAEDTVARVKAQFNAAPATAVAKAKSG